MTKTKVDIETLSIDEMLDLKDALDAKLSKLAKDEAGAMESRLQRLQAYLPDQDAPAPKAKASSKSKKPKASSKAKKTGGKRGKAPIKFRDPDSGNTWSGRGRTPIWLRDYEAAGRSRDAFSV